MGLGRSSRSREFAVLAAASCAVCVYFYVGPVLHPSIFETTEKARTASFIEHQILGIYGKESVLLSRKLTALISMASLGCMHWHTLDLASVENHGTAVVENQDVFIGTVRLQALVETRSIPIVPCTIGRVSYRHGGKTVVTLNVQSRSGNPVRFGIRAR